LRLGAPLVWRGLDVSQVVGRIIREYEATPNEDKPKGINVDTIGVGGGVADLLRRNKVLEADEVDIRDVNVADAPAVDELNSRLRDELWWQGREYFQARDCTFPIANLTKEQLEVIEELISELAAPTYDFTVAGKRVVMSKKDMKKELGKSPTLPTPF